MKTIKELRSDLDMMYAIYSNSVSSFLDYSYLLEPDTVEEKRVSQMNLYIIWTRYLLAEKSILEINKLFGSKRDSYSFKKLLNKILNNHRGSEWQKKISKKKIGEWQKRLNENSFLEVIRRINSWRDQYIAHTDKEREQHENIFIARDSMISFYRNCEEIFNEIMSCLYVNEVFRSSLNEPRNAYGILSALAKREILSPTISI